MAMLHRAIAILSLAAAGFSSPCIAASIVIGDVGGTGVLEANLRVPAAARIFLAAQDTKITGAEFKIEGLPEGWVAACVPNAAAKIVLGDPFGETGVNIAFADCRSGPNEALFQVTVLATSVEADVVLRVTGRTPPGNPHFDCPLVTLCDEPIFTKWCVPESETCVNPEHLNCYTAVSHKTWSAVKAVYR
jgi:hypothetical protein